MISQSSCSVQFMFVLFSSVLVDVCGSVLMSHFQKFLIFVVYANFAQKANMASDSSVFCKICWRNCEECYQSLEDNIIRQLSIVCYNLAIKLSADSVICNNCTDLLSTYCKIRYKLDGTCPTSLDEIKKEPNPIFGFLSTSTKLSIDQFTTGEQIVCRLCSSMASYHATDQITQLFPDLDPIYILSPNMCQKCMNVLNELAEFKKKCFKISELYNFNEMKLEEAPEFELSNSFTQGYYLQVEKCSLRNKKCVSSKSDLDSVSITLNNNLSRIEEVDIDSDIYKYKIYCREIEIKPLRRNETIVIICPQCKQAVKDIESHIKEHKDIFSKITYGCKSCRFRNESVTEMKNHHCPGQRKSESPDALYKCDICPFRAKQKGNLKTHKLIHKAPDKIPMYKCTTCKFQSRQKGNLQTHLLVHRKPDDIEMFKCPNCAYQARQRGNLQTHIVKKHKGSRDVELTNALYKKCKECPFMVKKYTTMKKHVSLCHRQ